jgi:hypothetical protein
MSDDFVRDLEDELVAAAAFRAHRRARRVAVPGLGSRRRATRPDRAALGGLLAAVMVLGLMAIVAGIAINGGGDRVADEPPVPPLPSTSAFPLVPMQPLTSCDEPARSDLPPGGLIDDVALLRRPQGEPDVLAFAPGRLPVGTFDPTATRRAASGRLRATVQVVPSQHIAADGRCRGDDGPGLCVVVDQARFRCFAAVDVIGGRAAAIDRDGWVIGIVPDGIDRVTLIGNGPPVTVDVADNAYEARLDELAGTQIQVAFGRDGDDGCRRKVAPDLPFRITALHEPAQPGYPLPRAALEVLNEWMGQLDAIVDDGARYWGGGDGVDFWVVPVVPRGSAACAPATRVCVIAVPERASADAHCVLGRKPEGADWRLGPLIEDRAVIYGVVPDGVDGAQVTIGDRTARVEAGLNVIGGVLPFPYRDGERPRVELMTRGQGSPDPRVAVVDAGGDAGAILDRLVRAGLETTGEVTAGVKPQERTVVYWWPERATREATARVAALVGADERQEVLRERAARPVLEAGAPIVVVVGTG